ncbi:MAG: amino acid ABC transporter permease [Dehalococcoidia bacterium]|nr:amino acid ABC transporter permease [Dehalococcoidia bacterium]
MTTPLFLAAVDWGYIGDHLVSRLVLEGVWMTLRLSLLGMFAGVALGTVFALMRLSRLAAVRWVAYFYIWFFRGTPLIVQIVFWFFARPQAWPSWAPWNGQMSPFVTGVVALAINEGAYMTEIMRAGIQSVDSGQTEAARSLGMKYSLAMRRIILPQAMRVVIPPTGNEFIAMLKNSSLVSVISVSELFLVAKLQYSSTLLYFEWLIIASIWYLVLTTVGSVFQAWLESRYNTNYGQAPQRSGLSRFLSFSGGKD